MRYGMNLLMWADTLTDAVLRLGWDFTNFGATSPTLTLRGDSSGQPGSVLANFTTPALTQDATNNYTFTPTSTVSLANGSTYWIVLSSVGYYEALSWEVDGNLNGSFRGIVPTGLGATYSTSTLAHSNSTDGGSTWISSTYINSFQIDGTNLDSGVPEPGTVSLMMAGLAGIAIIRRRKR